ncbi:MULTISPECIES: alpha/beta fold hydrolase [unclassified Pseudoalteromonas]|uniref:alpha/beta fold hydrolase n=1 Tax=unclassified Pseudoalteromonas TaxID=194690 RepID=UPI001107E049|nr:MULTISPECIES: alpha/beta fold hydrolase [unclassified Pseudoalteromonas]TMN70794.1 lysophospholipase [Pseudoalteromonas sp. S1727]
MFYSTESDLLARQPEISQFFAQQVNKALLTTTNGDLYYGYAIPEQPKAAIVISSGRIEGLDKYQELIWELFKNNYAVFIVDHQGQGRSYRALANPHKGFVNKFTDYADDLALFDSQIVNTLYQGKKVMLGHSMGGAIAVDFLTRFKHNYSGVFLSAPMFDIYTKGTPKPLAKLAARTACLLGFNQCYALGQTDYLAYDFLNNDLTSSEVRYQLFRQTYQSDSILQLGGVTYGWLNAAFGFMATLEQQQLTLPVFIASAENDTVVDNQAQIALVHRQNNAVLQTFAGAKHELLFEQDTIRQAVLSRFYQFCDSLN